MLENWIEPSTVGKLTLEVKLAGLTDKDFRFLKAVVAMFSDPEYKALADTLREGDFAIQYDPADGQARLVDLTPSPVEVPPREIVLFLKRFNAAEWAVMSKHKAELFRHFRNGLASAEKFVLRVLGYKVRPAKTAKVFGE